jgi:2-polyprenyl-3-methyl-5-hydroxy-6-metoxy-1,4-benzoquinol methylase
MGTTWEASRSFRPRPVSDHAMPSDAPFQYVGSELDLFSAATRWKSYLSDQLQPYLGTEVLEVGAGIGATTRLLCGPNQRRWVGLEPDTSLAGRAVDAVRSGALPRSVEIRSGTLDALTPGETFDTILYVDVLEHIEDDAGELAKAAGHLRPGGFLAVLAPAHQWLFSPFDEAIGHFRRYTRRSLRSVASSSLRLERLRYLDSVGLLASAANRVLLRQSMPTAAQVQLWDRFMVPASRRVDRLIGFSAGKSVLDVWRRI